MVKFKGFETKAAALAYKKKHGGMLCHKEKYSHSKVVYDFAVHLGELDEKKYPYCVVWDCV